MNFYQEITLFPCEELGLYFILEKVFAQLHFAFVDNDKKNKSVLGLSFPKYYKKGLSNQLRLFSKSEEELTQFNLESHLCRLVDYVQIKPINPVPDLVKYAHFKRKYARSIHKKVKNRAKHRAISYDEAYKFMSKNNQLSECSLPFVQVVSQSTEVAKESLRKNRFKLFIEKKITDNEKIGKFDNYGLSKTATVPIF